MIKENKYKPNIEFLVEEESLLLDYLLTHIENKSKNNIKSILSRGNVLIEGVVTTKFDKKLKVGQRIVINLSQIHDNSHKSILDIIYEDDEFIIINKPAGLLSISTDSEKDNTAYNMVRNYVKQKDSKSRIFIVHRLDRDTSGVLMLAKNESIKLALQDKWDKIVTIRGYMAVVEGKVKQPSGTIKSWLKETSTLLVYSSFKEGDGREAITHYKKIKETDKYTLLEIRIDTGRKNQIRVHMKDIGVSIVGDKKYGATTDPLRRLGLHANILEFTHPITRKVMHFEAKTPTKFLSMFKK